MRDRLLVRHFLWRFMEHDLISPNADRLVALSAIGAAVISVSLFVSVLIALRYQFDNFMPPGIASIRSLDDRFLCIAASMLLMALAAVAQWDALALDARDTAVLGALPIPRRAIVRAKFIAVSLFASVVLMAWNLSPILFRPWSLPIGLPIGWLGAVRLTGAQGVVSLAAGAFGFLAVLGLREVSFAVLGARRFQSISAALQAALVVLLTTGGLLLPVASTEVARGWLAAGGRSAKLLPPLWFVGLHEQLVGDVLDHLPRTHPVRFLVGRELAATDLYRSLWPLYGELATIAIIALPVVASVAILACWWNSRRLPTAVHRKAAGIAVVSRGWNWLAVHAVARTPLCQAGFFFALQTLTRRASHRVPMAASLAVGVSLVVLAMAGGAPSHGSDVTTIPSAMLAAQTLLTMSLLSGFRHATQVPAGLHAGSTFSLAWSGNQAPYVAGVKRAGWTAIVLPALVGLGVVQTAMLGPRLAALHFVFGLLVAALLMETLFLRYSRVPFVSSYVPSGELKSRSLLYLVTGLLVSFSLAWVERIALATVTGFIVLLATLVALNLVVMACDRVSLESALAFDDEPERLPTQRLNLAR